MMSSQPHLKTAIQVRQEAVADTRHLLFFQTVQTQNSMKKKASTNAVKATLGPGSKNYVKMGL